MQRRVAWYIFVFWIFNDFSSLNFHKLHKSIAEFSSVTCTSSSCWIEKLQASEASLSPKFPSQFSFRVGGAHSQPPFFEIVQFAVTSFAFFFPYSTSTLATLLAVCCGNFFHRRPISSRPVVTCFQKKRRKKKKSSFHMLRISFCRSGQTFKLPTTQSL